LHNLARGTPLHGGADQSDPLAIDVVDASESLAVSIDCCRNDGRGDAVHATQFVRQAPRDA